MRILFAGTPEFAAPALDWLIERNRPIAVLSQPDRPAGRGRKLRASAVKQRAEKAGIPVLQPSTLKSAAILETLKSLHPELLVTAAYGLLLPPAVLQLPRLGCWNLHASLLPRWRGASPIQQAILAGDDESGVTLMQMDAGLDTGDMIVQRRTRIAQHESAGQLHDRLAVIAAELLGDALEQLAHDQLPGPEPQDDQQARHAPLIEKQQARLDWTLDAATLARRVRAYNPWPVAFGPLDGQVIRVFQARALESRPAGVEPGRAIIEPDHADRLRISCGSGALEILELQSPNRRRMSAPEWLRAQPRLRA
ncbi:MAG: methionyl-tRNA formyltransferase [Xanthomonadaceae bacterium]|nr:methionyl-tRNA formyltransferase [Xanthomonadaceae bacterium]